MKSHYRSVVLFAVLAAAALPVLAASYRCPPCNGAGVVLVPVSCSHCKGTGQLVQVGTSTDVCAYCSGTGRDRDINGLLTNYTCRHCLGSRVLYNQRTSTGPCAYCSGSGSQQQRATCPTCNGTGAVYRNEPAQSQPQEPPLWYKVTHPRG